MWSVWKKLILNCIYKWWEQYQDSYKFQVWCYFIIKKTWTKCLKIFSLYLLYFNRNIYWYSLNCFALRFANSHIFFHNFVNSDNCLTARWATNFVRPQSQISAICNIFALTCALVYGYAGRLWNLKMRNFQILYPLYFWMIFLFLNVHVCVRI